MSARMGDVMRAPFDLLLGRRTYEIFAAHWPHAGDQPGAAELNRATKYVASRTLDELDWANSTLLEGDVPEAFRLWFFPVVLGGGKRLFADGAVPAGMRLVDSTTSSTGVLIATYERAGEVDHGSFALEQPTDAEVERRRRLSED